MNTGVPDNHSLGFSLNKRTEKFNLFSQVGVGKRKFPENYKGYNRNETANTEINNFGERDKGESFLNVILGTDYHINDNNVLSLTGNFAYEWESETSLINYSAIGADNVVSSAWQRDEVTSATNPKWQFEMQYKKDFSDKKDHFLLISALGSSFSKDQESSFNNTPEFGEEALSDQQQTQTDFGQVEYTFKADYTQPFTEKLLLKPVGNT